MITLPGRNGSGVTNGVITMTIETTNDTIEKTAIPSPRTPSRLRRTAAVFSVAAALIAGTLAMSTGTAGAYWHSTSLTLQGRAICSTPVASPSRGNATWVYVKASNGQRGWATNGKGRYKFVLKNVPRTGKIRVVINFGNAAGKCHAIIKYGRTAGAPVATRDLIQPIVNGEA